ncbi:MAG: sulfatase family protein [Planctomycetota bacterium]|jgi:arylsulfatase A-like enzyme
MNITHLDRRNFLKYIGVAAAVTQISDFMPQVVFAQDEKEANSSKPNFLWICTDQQRWNTIAALGNKHIHTPNLDRLVRMGTSFTKAHCVGPVCTASRANFLTGMYPSAVAGCKNGAAYWPEKAPLVTKLLKDAGYACGLSGKLHLSSAYGSKGEKRPENDGYSEFYYSHSPWQGWPENDYLQWLKDKGYEYERVKEMPWAQQAPLHQTTWCCDRAIDFMKRHKGKPWLFSVNIFDPHGPFDPPKDFLEHCGYNLDNIPLPLFKKTDLNEKAFVRSPRNPTDLEAKTTLAKYWAMVELIDDNVGHMLKALKETGQMDSTVIIFTSDHGEMAGDHGLYSKGLFYEGSIRVPLIFAGPGICKNRQVDSLVELTELAPTILKMAGLPLPSKIQGKSLVAVLEGKTDKVRDFLHGQHYACTGPAEGSPDWEEDYSTMYRDDKYKHIVYHGRRRGELFDMQADPNEFENLWDESALREKRDELLLKNFNAAAIANYPVMPVMQNKGPAGKRLQLHEKVYFENKPDKEMPGHWISIYEDDGYRLEVSHASGTAKLYDTIKVNLWAKADSELKYNMLRRCFDIFAFSIIPGPKRTGRY